MLTLISKRETVRKPLWFAIWASAMYGSLQLHHFEASLGHAICGPWGCGPPVAALLGFHAFWFLLIVPPAMAVSYYLPAGQAVHIGRLLAIAGLGALAWVVVADGVNFWKTAHGGEYLLQRGLFRLATFVEVPLGPLGLAGIAIRQLGMRRIRQETSLPARKSL